MSRLPRPAYFVLWAALAAFYCGVLLLALRPEVTPAYRLYYLEQRLRHWSQGRGPAYAPGEVLDFSAPVPQLSRRGWGPEGPGGTWSLAGGSELVFLLPPGARPRLLAFTGQPGPEPGQTLTVLAAGRVLGAASFPTAERTRLGFPLPGDLPLGPDGRLVIAFRHAWPGAGAGPEEQAPAFRFETLELR